MLAPPIGHDAIYHIQVIKTNVFISFVSSYSFLLEAS
jgi:hypothetical protein